MYDALLPCFIFPLKLCGTLSLSIATLIVLGFLKLEEDNTQENLKTLGYSVLKFYGASVFLSLAFLHFLCLLNFMGNQVIKRYFKKALRKLRLRIMLEGGNNE